MRFKKVLLVNPAYSRSFFSIPALPAGLGYLAQSLKANNIEYQILDMSLGYTYKDLEKRISQFQPQLLAISSMSYMLADTYQAIARLKQRFAGLKVVIGGPHASSVQEKILEECSMLDFAVVFEGESSLVELCQGLAFSEIKGLIYRDDSRVKFCGLREFVSDLDSLEFPRYQGFELKRYGYGIGIVGSRGCPYRCIYCSCNVIGKKIRFRSPSSIVDEIDYWYRQGYREFGFQEDNPSFDKARMLEICTRLQRKAFKDLRLMCGNGVRADRVDRGLLIEMKKAGFKRLAFGIESASNKVLKAIKKGTTVEAMDRAICEASRLGFFIDLLFLVGSPEETPRDVEASITLALKYPVQYVDFFNLVPMPGSELFNWVQEKGYFLRRPEEYLNARFHPARSTKPIFQTPEFPARQRRQMLFKTQRITALVKRKALEQKFPQTGIFGKALFWLYCTKPINRLENLLLRRQVLRHTIGQARMKIRNMFYKD